MQSPPVGLPDAPRVTCTRESQSFWSSGAVCDPLVTTTLRDLVTEARRTGDWSDARAFHARLAPTAAPLFPHGSFKIFSTYNIGLEKARMDAGGWMKAGPIRPPYHIVPEEYLAGARKSGEMWAAIGRELREAGARPLSSAA